MSLVLFGKNYFVVMLKDGDIKSSEHNPPASADIQTVSTQSITTSDIPPVASVSHASTSPSTTTAIPMTQDSMNKLLENSPLMGQIEQMKLVMMQTLALVRNLLHFFLF